jgi:uncharacterized pyridoxamine 5'-phosphate oxidase family protein
MDQLPPVYNQSSQPPQVPPASPRSTIQPLYPEPRRSKLPIVITAIIIVLALGTVAFAYIEKIGPFKVASYSESTFFTNLLKKGAGIHSASYMASAALNVGPRAAGAEPFTTKISNTAALRQKYQNDVKRANDVSSIVNLLQSATGNYYTGFYEIPTVQTNGKTAKPKTKPYPASLQALKESLGNNSYYKTLTFKDPGTGKEYDYKLTDNGSNFALTVTFETGDAISAIKRGYNYAATTTPVQGMTATFTKASYTYLYLQSEPPKPFIVELGEMMRQMPPDVDVSGSVSAATDFKQGALADWLFNFNAQGSFGDLSYKVNVDALKKGSDYYFKINNMPSILFGSYATIKGKWVKVTSQVATTSKNSYSSDLGSELPKLEKEYKEKRDKIIKLLVKAASIADEEKLVAFKSSPRKEKIEGRELVRYDITIRKEAILPFYKKLGQEVDSNPDYSDFKGIVDQGLIEYLESKEFDEVFDYYNKNSEYIFWTDIAGFPAAIQNTLRIIPPDTATQLKGKQVNIIFKLGLNDINKPVTIEAPTGAVSLETVMKDFEKNAYGSDGELAAMKSNLSFVRSQAEIVYDKTKQSYGTKPFTLGACKQTASTLFANKDVFASITKATNDNPSKATCVSKGTTGKVTSYAVSVPLPDDADYSWCIDSTGQSKQIMGNLKSDSCE